MKLTHKNESTNFTNKTKSSQPFLKATVPLKSALQWILDSTAV